MSLINKIEQWLLPSTDDVLSRLLRWTKRVGENQTTTTTMKTPTTSFSILEHGLAWTSVAVFTIRYMLDYIKLIRKMAQLRRHITDWWSYPIPLCALAHTRAELDISIQERWKRLWRALQQDHQKNDDVHEKIQRNLSMMLSWSDDKWIDVFHSSLAVRKEASYLMYQLSMTCRRSTMPQSSQQQQRYRIDQDDGDDTTIQNKEEVISIMQRLWPRLLEFPESIRNPTTNSMDQLLFRLAVIIPMYQEPLETIQRTLLHARKNCQNNPQHIQIIIVNADTAINTTTSTMTEISNTCGNWKEQLLAIEKKQSQSTDIPWGELQVINLPPLISSTGTKGGRGRTLNAGIPLAKAPIVTFLHADTLVPPGWDIQIQQALLPTQQNNDTAADVNQQIFPQGCAFTMGIDIDQAASNSNNTPGLWGAQLQGILRCHCGLPYGDSVLSFTKTVLEYIGGYPEQPLMEDYELMDWFRMRSMLLRDKKSNNPTEHWVILPDQAKCSPRRWQKYGVAYTNLVNAICIYRYRHCRIPAEELFDFYYHH
jgi:hypothetical protein